MTRTLWLGLMAVLILAGGAVPYGLLAGAGPSLAVPLFWAGFGLAVIALIAAALARWRV
ncbi:MAG: hypothetical protein IE927_12070 [Rhodobacterales bacterium]|nr:hypothetical protein [Rhodobacterales bacterium]